MALFLNTRKISEAILELIRNAEREIVIIVPYIKTSENLYNELLLADKRGVETTIVYRENKLHGIEKEKFFAIDNLNLMHHPNIHAKCYYNGDILIITSMNMYEYSEINNREMGIFLENLDDGGDIFEDAIEEINTIINCSHIEKKSRETIEEGFIIDIIKPKLERAEDYCKKLSKIFIHKKFIPIEGFNGEYLPTCNSYFDKINVIIDYRVELHFLHNEDIIKVMHSKLPLEKKQFEYNFKGFKVYWDYYKSPLTIYRDRNFKYWDNISGKEDIKRLKEGIDDVIAFLKPLL